jgi:hypothetical protein
LAQGDTIAEVSETTCFVERWVEELLARYNALGPRALVRSGSFTLYWASDWTTALHFERDERIELVPRLQRFRHLESEAKMSASPPGLFSRYLKPEV